MRKESFRSTGMWQVMQSAVAFTGQNGRVPGRSRAVTRKARLNVAPVAGFGIFMRGVAGGATERVSALDVAFASHQRIGLVGDEKVLGHGVGEVVPIAVALCATLDLCGIDQLRGIVDRAGRHRVDVRVTRAMAVFTPHAGFVAVTGTRGAVTRQALVLKLGPQNSADGCL